MSLTYKLWTCLPFLVSALSCYGYSFLNKKYPQNLFFYPAMSGLVGFYYFACVFCGFLFSLENSKEINKKEMNQKIMFYALFSVQPLLGIILLALAGAYYFFMAPLKYKVE